MRLENNINLIILLILLCFGCENTTQPDTTPPNGIIVTPLAGQHLKDIVEIKVNASDNDEIAFVSFFIDSVLMDNDSLSPYSYLWDTNLAKEDTDHFITITISDVSGNETNIQPICVYVDNIEQYQEIPPYPPTDINVYIENNSIYLTWTSSFSNNVHNYIIFKNNSYLTSLDSSITSFIDTNYTYYENICYYIKSVTISGTESVSSQTACITTPQNPNLFDLKIIVGCDGVIEGCGTILQIFQNSTSNSDLIYESRKIYCNEIVIDYDVLPPGNNYIARMKTHCNDDIFSPYTIFSVEQNIQVNVGGYNDAPSVSEWNP